jgi:hypothetical protein
MNWRRLRGTNGGFWFFEKKIQAANHQKNQLHQEKYFEPGRPRPGFLMPK